jgi:amicyanin
MNNNVKIAILALIVFAGLGFYYWKINMSKQLMMEGKPTPTPLFVQGNEPAQDVAMQPAGENIAVPIKNFTFTPTELRIKVGQTVTWTNEDSAQHDVVANDGSFKSELLSKGQSFSFTFTKAGTYDYVCTLHAPMKAKVIVE